MESAEELEDERLDEAADGDRGLLARHCAGDRSAWAELCDAWRPRIRGYLIARGFGQEDAEDLTQECLIQLYLAPHNPRFGAETLRSYVLTIAKNQRIREYRRRARRVVTVPADCEVEEDANADEADPQSRRIRENDAADLPAGMVENLYACVWSLPPPERDYILLCGRHGLGCLDHQEIAERCGVGPRRVSELSRRALAKLLKAMLKMEKGR